MTVSQAEITVPLAQSAEILERRVPTREERLNAHPPAVDAPGDLSRLMADVVRVTQDLFPGEVAIRAMHAPDHPQAEFTVIEAQASGVIEEVVDRRAEWHRRVIGLSPACSTLRLTLDYLDYQS
jgi:hypothetical protein